MEIMEIFRKSSEAHKSIQQANNLRKELKNQINELIRRSVVIDDGVVLIQEVEESP